MVVSVLTAVGAVTAPGGVVSDELPPPPPPPLEDPELACGEPVEPVEGLLGAGEGLGDGLGEGEGVGDGEGLGDGVGEGLGAGVGEAVGAGVVNVTTFETSEVFPAASVAVRATL